MIDVFFEILSLVLIWLGIILMIISGVGIIRFPDFYIRMSAITKAATMGVGLILLGISVHFNDVGIAFRSILIILFLLLTSPIAAHIIARAAYEEKVPFWRKTNNDEFKEQLKEKHTEAEYIDQKGKVINRKEGD